MTKIPTILPRAFAQLRQHQAAHRKALAARMTRIPMVADPGLPEAERDDTAHRARRAIQYAGWLGQRAGTLPADLSGFNGEWIEAEGLAIFIRADESQEVAAVIAIPRHVLDFDPGAPALALPPAPEPVEPSRCTDTADMLACAPKELARPAPKVQHRQRSSAKRPANDNSPGRAVTGFCLPRGSVGVDFTMGRR